MGNVSVFSAFTPTLWNASASPSSCPLKAVLTVMSVATAPRKALIENGSVIFWCDRVMIALKKTSCRWIRLKSLWTSAFQVPFCVVVQMAAADQGQGLRPAHQLASRLGYVQTAVSVFDRHRESRDRSRRAS